jgi:twinfilin-like protein
MTHGASFAVMPELLQKFNESGGARALKVRIENEAFALEACLDATSDVTADFAQMRTTFLKDSEACYVIFRGGDDAWSLISFVPDSAPVRDKMTYSSGRAALQKAFGQDRIPTEQHFSELAEVALPGADVSEEARVEEQLKVMTDIERLKIEADSLMAAEAAAGKVSSVAGLTFPQTAEASEGLSELLGGKIGALLLSIDGETLTQRGRAESVGVAEVKALLPAEPCYCLYRWSHERDGAQNSALLFLYICPEDAPVRAKMLHASTKGPFITQLEAAGFEFAKSIEGIEAAELTDAELTTQLYGGDETAGSSGPKIISKAAPRGGRKLVKKTRPAVEE